MQSLTEMGFWQDIAWFMLFAATLLVGRSFLRTFVKGLGKKDDRFRSTFTPFVLTLINWLTMFAILLFALIYFANSKWVFTKLFSLGKVEVSVFVLILAVLILLLTHRSAKMIIQYVLPAVYERYHLDRGLRFSFDRVFYYLAMVLAVFVSLTTVGIDLSALTVFAGFLGVGIGFGMQNIMSNFISGLILLFERPIKVGDRVKIQGVVGDVEKINMRATIIKTLDNEHIIMPNSYFLEEQVVNRSYADPRLRVVIPVGVAYGSDVKMVKEILERSVDEERRENTIILQSPAPFVNFAGFGASSLDFELYVWIKDPTYLVQVKSNFYFRIHGLLSEHRIEIPFPQRDLHVRSIDTTVKDAFTTWKDKER
ncbi:mechanosensitive ion channel family protein [Mechercharimyces sp. CAU 1602]|uniref:mechanosensitive ion channel family protein n=1 Tax=Mechercharimyces sp. CAU 1602 TaxID=2973933 RepID=UPI002163F005|nr:mechanosensitive ion channel domain-containing protein [Mechercharimyces sp. CAU 1602]